MSLEVIDNLFMLLAAIIGLLMSLFHYIETPKRGWLYVTSFFLAHLVSDYYWTTYTLVVGEIPDVSAFMAYLGWNVGYLFLLLAVLKMRDDRIKGYFHPLMLLPVPINLCQFLLYNTFGGFFNNLWQSAVHTVMACICLQVILYRIKTRKEEPCFPYFHLAALLFSITQYGMWTSSCFDWPSEPRNPYYYFAFANYLVMMFLPRIARNDYEKNGYVAPEKSASEIRFQMLIQILLSFIIFSGCVGGYYLAVWMKQSLPAATEDNNTYSVIAVTLFIISLFLVGLILAILLVVAVRYKGVEHVPQETVENKRKGYGLFFTIVITFVLMVFSVVYTSRLFYRISVTEVHETGQDKATLIATEIDNYITNAVATLEATADTVDLMYVSGDPQYKIKWFLTEQTQNQFTRMDENFTGLYGYIRGEFIDGSGWVPPEGFNSEERDWYKQSVEAKGGTIIVSPYVDAHTESIVITICRMISDGTDPESVGRHNVVALDILVNYIQELVEQADIGGKGVGWVMNGDGMIIAHNDRDMVGQNMVDIYGQELFDSLNEVESGILDSRINGDPCTFFVDRVKEYWTVVIMVTDSELFEETNSQLLVNILVSLIIFSLISFFYFLGYRNEQAYGKSMEEMRIGQQKQEYEAQVLKLEKKSADEANKAKSSFLADMSHEIRTPINAILGMNEMILREADNPGIREYSQNIDISGKNLLQLVNSILDFSKIEDGKMEIVPVRYSLSSLISYLVNSISERASGKGLELVVNVDPGLPSELYGDDARINQVIMNLLTNAVKYTREGTVTLSFNEREREGDRVLIYAEVRDTGIGIKEEDMGRLFESFERLDVVKNRNIEGTGLGMSITTRLLKLMESELKVESVYGEGSVFYFELWQGIENASPIGDYRLIQGEASGRESLGGGLYAPDARILITDDTKMNLTVALNLLKRTGIQIDTAQKGEDAIKLSEENDYDVILMDQRMPGIDGTETLKKIRALENGRNNDTPVICLTADAIRGARDRYIAEGFDDYLTKPVSGESLEQMLITYLPPEKVQSEMPSETGVQSEMPVEIEPHDEKEEDTGGRYYALEKAGVSIEQGLAVCMDEEVYLEVLAEYARESIAHREKLEECYINMDWHDYNIYVHSLKSSSKSIGAMELSEIAASLEKASLDGDEARISAEHRTAMEKYEEVTEAILSVLHS